MAELKTDNGIPVPQWYDQELDDWVFYTNEYMKELLSKIESLQEELEEIKSAQTDGSQKVQVSGSEEFAQDVTVQEVKSELEAVKSELEAVKSGIETLKENQTSGDQKVQLSGTIKELYSMNIADRPDFETITEPTSFTLLNATLDTWVSDGSSDWVEV